MTDTTTDKGLVERLRIAADVFGTDHHARDLHAAADTIERLEREREEAIFTAEARGRRMMTLGDEIERMGRAKAAEARLSRITAPVEGMETTEEIRAEVAAHCREVTAKTSCASMDHRTLAVRCLEVIRDLETLSARLRVAEEAEREACAKLVEALPQIPDPLDGGRRYDEAPHMIDPSRAAIAAAIRSRRDT